MPLSPKPRGLFCILRCYLPSDSLSLTSQAERIQRSSHRIKVRHPDQVSWPLSLPKTLSLFLKACHSWSLTISQHQRCLGKSLCMSQGTNNSSVDFPTWSSRTGAQPLASVPCSSMWPGQVTRTCLYFSCYKASISVVLHNLILGR